MYLSIPEIVASLRVSRAEFARLFLQVQADEGLVPEGRVEFEGIALEGVDSEAFTTGLLHAQNKGWLKPLVHLIVQNGLEDGGMAKALIAAAPPGSAALNAITNAAAGFDNPEAVYRGVASGMRWTVKILVDGAAKGTGILIGPHLVLTAWHVLKPLFNVNGADGRTYTADDEASQRIQVEFDDFLSLVKGGVYAPHESLRVSAHKNWCVVFSPCHVDELSSRLPADLRELDGMWDYVVVRLAQTPGLERRWAPLDARAVVPRNKSVILVFQHPDGQPLKFNRNDIVEPDPAEAAIVPQLRFLHRANATGGSSGGPCFDKSFTLFGLHQGAWTRPGENGAVINRGVPLVRVKEHFDARISELPSPEPCDCQISQLGARDLQAPVIGCDEFQSAVWRSAIAGSKKIIWISGDPGGGKTFRTRLLAVMLADSGHLKIELNASTISKMSATELAGAICKGAGAPVPDFAPAEKFASTVAIWLRDEVCMKVVAALESVRAGRLVWLILVDLNKTGIWGDGASDLMYDLYLQTAALPWLRVVLDGMQGDLPSALERTVAWEETSKPTRRDMEAFLKRAIVGLGENPDNLTVSTHAVSAMKDFEKWRAKRPQEAMRLLSEKAMEILEIYLDVIHARGNS
ncbi:trypsin-like serine peptidase [Caballeronia sordidicola]|uniref:trypsin-like serine peptidase n=1 Tax=Caballeronia sordidicola TaxID=196367 RepID=UPI0004D00E10|nr:serine protease [Caballeronia sordidicola]